MKTFKLVNLIAFIVLLTSCSKTEDPLQPVLKVECDNITLLVNNKLPNDIDDILIGNQNFGTIGAGETATLCLDQSYGYTDEPEQLMLFLQAKYNDEEITDGFFCGTGLVNVVTGEYEIDLNEVNDNFIFYTFK